MTARDKRVLFVGLTVAMAILLYTYVLDPLQIERKRVAESIENKILLTQKYNALISGSSAISNDFQKLQTMADSLGQYMLNGNSTALAAADLQKTLKEMAKSLKISIESEKVADPFAENIFMVVPVEIVIKSNLEKLMNFLYKIETGNKFIDIENIKIKSDRKPGSRGEELIESKILTRGFFFLNKTTDTISKK